MAWVVIIPDFLEMLLQKLILLHASDLGHLAEDVAGGDVCFVLGEDATAIGFTEGSHVLANCLSDVLFVVSHFFFLLDQAELFLSFFLLGSGLGLLLEFFLVRLLFFFSLLLVNFLLFFLLSVLWAVHPFDMCLSLVVLVHECHYFVEFRFVLTLLLGITILSIDRTWL